jgi:hypothetical protein
MRERRQQRAVHEPLAVLLGVPDDRNQIPAVSLGEADDLGDGYRYSAVLTDRDDHLSDAA